MSSTQPIGLGSLPSDLIVCIGNRPPIEALEKLTTIRPLANNEITSMVEQTGNHWRKIFNIFAKLMFELEPKHAMTWQQYRDEQLLQRGNQAALLFSNPSSFVKQGNAIVLISGKQYAEQLGLLKDCIPLDNGFFQNPNHRLIITPYFDYRQLSNAKLLDLVKIIKNMPK
jgi:hypothetical protein